ncbi:putative membrane protein, partial [hydrothermal vent metagenome]
FALFTISQAADAKRFGGGKSFGYSKSVPSKSFDKSKKAPQAAPKAAPAAAGAGAKSRSGMMGVLGGLAAGGLLAAMFMGDGFEGIQIMDILLFALLAFVLFKLFRHFAGRSRAEGSPQPAYQANHEPMEEPSATPQKQNLASRETAQEYQPQSGESIFGSNLGTSVSEEAVVVSEAPAWFDAESFAEGAKGHFVTLQKAWDNKDLSEVESYCSSELFEAIKQEMKDIQAGENHTVVDTLDAEIADMAIDGDYFIVSIRFTGFIKEGASEDAHAFNEIWHIRRLANDEGTWQVAGIQQNS